MLEYTHDEAIEMLTKNKVIAEEKLVGGVLLEIFGTL